MITDAHVFGIMLQKWIFFYLPRFAVKWNVLYTEIQWNFPTWRLLPWAFLLSFLPINGVLRAFAAVDFTYIHSRPDFTTIHLLVNAAAPFILIIYCFFVVLTLWNIDLYLATFNQILRLERSLIGVFYKKLGRPVSSDTGIFLILMTLTGGAIPLVVIVNDLLANYDPMYFILEQYVMEDPMYRSMQQYILSRLVRLVLLFPLFFESARTALAFLSMLLIMGDSEMEILNIMEYRVKELDVSGRLYIVVTLYYRNLQTFMEAFLYVGPNVPFWLIVALVWVLIRASDKMPTLALFVSVLFLVALVCGVAIFIPKYIKVIGCFNRILEKQRQEARAEWIKRKTRKSKIMWKESLALAQMRFKAGKFFYITEDFMMEYFYLLTQRVVDAIMIYEY